MQVRQLNSENYTWTLWFDQDKVGEPKKWQISTFNNQTGVITEVLLFEVWAEAVEYWRNIMSEMPPTTPDGETSEAAI